MLKQRIITALALFVILLGVLSYPSPWAFPLFMTVLVSAAGWEWGRLSGLTGAAAWSCAVAMALACAGLMLGGGNFAHHTLWAWVATAWSAIWLLYAYWLLRAGIPAWQRIPRAVRLVLGFVSLGMAWIAIVWLHGQNGISYLLSVIALVWMADIAAYFAGRAFGKRKLAPQISPGKSWAGAVGGTLGVVLMAVLGAAFLPYDNFYTQTVRHAGWPALVGLTVGIAAVSIMGDLVESLMKRSTGLKDSSNLLPGHGGVLDRIDSLLPVLPLALAATLWMQG